MKVHLLKKKAGHFSGFSEINHLLFFLAVLMFGIKSPLWAEGSKDFVNYPGYRMFLDTRDAQQLKVYANEGETINLGSSHLGIQGGFISVYDPAGNLFITYNTPGATGDPGIINNNIEEMAGPTGGGTTMGNGYVPLTIDVPVGMAGIWTVVFDYPTYTNAAFTNILNNAPWTRANDQPNTTRVVLAWDITITTNGAGNMGGTPVEGRVYTNEHISLINQNGFTTSPTFYVLTQDGYLYQVNINEADPFRFPISSNSFGLVNGNGVPIYKSKPEADFVRSDDPASWDPNNLYLYEPQAQDNGALINNKIFFNIPSPDLPASAPVTDIYRSNPHTTWLLDDLEILTIDSLYLIAQSSSGSPCTQGTIEFAKGGFFVFQTNLGGVVTLQLDLNNNHSYNDPVDVTLMGTLNEGVDSLFWDGLDGLGNPIAVQDSFTFNYQGNIRFGELHIALTDVEGNTGGVEFEWLNAPAGFPTDQFYYDHSDIDPNIAVSVSGGGTPGNALPTNIPYTYPLSQGNDVYFDQWFFIEQSIAEQSVTVNVVLDCFCDPQDTPDIALAGNDVCAGDPLTLSATNANTTNGLSPIDYTWTGPANFQFTDNDVDPAGTSTANVSGAAMVENTGTYQVIATTSALCADTVSIDITVTPTPVLQTNNSNVQVCQNDNVQLCASNTTAGIGQLDCTWTGPNGFIEQATGNGTDQICLDLTNVGPTLAGDYTLVCSANGCDSDPLVISLSIQPTPEINNTSPGGDFCEGEDVVLTASNNVAGTGPIIFSWTGPNFSMTDTTVNENGPFSTTISNIQPSNAGDYTLVLTTLAGCASAPQSVNIGVNPLPQICNETGGGDACVGQTVTLSAFNCAQGTSGSFDYAWTAPGGSNVCTGTAANDGPFVCEVANIQDTDSGQYCLSLIDNVTGCVADVVCVNINVLPSINITGTTPDSSYCEGESVTLTAATNFGADVIYTWTGPGGVVLCSETVSPGTPLTCNIDSLTTATAGDYTLTVASLDGCMSDPVTVSVGLLDGITINTISANANLCLGDMLQLSGTGIGSAISVNYVWTNPNGQAVGSGTTGPAGPFNATDPNPLSGTYTLTVTTPDGCSDMGTVEVTINDTPMADILNDDTLTLCEGDSLILCGQNTNPNVGPFTYTWTTPTGATITGSGNGTTPFCDEIVPASTYGEGTYSLEICAGGCCSDIVSINVNLNPNPILSPISGGGTYCEGDTAIICFSNINPEVTDWFYTCIIDTAQVTDIGTGTDEICVEVTSSTFIFCSLESMDGCVSDLEGTQVTFEQNFTPNIDVPTTVCANDTLQLNGSNPFTCTGNVTYTWTGPGGFTFTGTAPCNGPFPAGDPSPESGEYCLDLDGGAGGNCSDQVCITVEVFEVPFISPAGAIISGGGDYCQGDIISLSGTVENPSSGDIFYELTQNGTVVDTGTVASGTPVTYIINNANDAVSGLYCLNLTCINTGCSDEDLGCTQVTVNSTPSIDSLSGSGTYCQGFDVMLNGSGLPGPGIVTYTWTGPNYFFMGTAPCGGPYPATIDSIDLDQAGVYTLVVDKGGCTSDSAQVVVEVNPTPDIINVTSGGEECAGASIPISFTIDPDGADMVDWTINGPGLDEGGTVTELTEFTFDIVVSGPATYIITAISDQGCEADPVTITITPIEVPVPVIDGPSEPCPGETIVLCTDVAQGATFTWFLNGTSIGGPFNDPCITLTDPQEGTYTVVILLNGCTKESAPYELAFPPSPDAADDNFTTDAGVPVSGNILSNDNTGGGVTVNVTSPPSNGTVTVDANGEMTYTPDSGFSGDDQFTYEICAVVCVDDCDEATVTITVSTPPCEVPNVITPNGDGVNDVLIIQCVPAFPNNRLRIFNRWGDEIDVFEPYENNWDGTIGESKDPVPAGTYFYIFQEDRNSDNHLAGYIKVVR